MNDFGGFGDILVVFQSIAKQRYSEQGSKELIKPIVFASDLEAWSMPKDGKTLEGLQNLKSMKNNGKPLEGSTK